MLLVSKLTTKNPKGHRYLPVSRELLLVPLLLPLLLLLHNYYCYCYCYYYYSYSSSSYYYYYYYSCRNCYCLAITKANAVLGVAALVPTAMNAVIAVVVIIALATVTSMISPADCRPCSYCSTPSCSLLVATSTIVILVAFMLTHANHVLRA